MIETLLSVVAVSSAGYCLVSAFQYRKARKRFEAMTGEYMSVVNSAVQQGNAESLADHVQMCGGCGGFFPQSQIEACGKNQWGEKCPNYQMMLAERDAT